MSDGPDQSWLQNLAHFIPKYVKAKQAGMKRRGTNPRMPSHLCRICGALFGAGTVEGSIVSSECPQCRARMNEGQSALKCGDDYAFVNSPNLRDAGGKGRFWPVKPKVMQWLKKKFKEQQDVKPAPDSPGGA